MALYKPNAKSHDPLYKRWRGIRDRCRPTAQAHKYYYDKGIAVCDEWLNDFYSFKEWALTNGYKPELTIDRIDDSKGYSPDNCRWVTKSFNVKRNSNRKLITIGGVTQDLQDWCNQLNISRSSIIWAIREKGFTHESYIRYRMQHHNISRSKYNNKDRQKIIDQFINA